MLNRNVGRSTALQQTLSILLISFRFFALAFFVLLLSILSGNNAFAQGRGAGIVNSCGRLQVKDAHVCSENGTRISLGGMSFFWSGWAPKYYNAATVNYLVDNMKVSLVRAAYGVPAGQGPMGDVQDVRNVIDAAIARGIYVIIDWHGEGDMTPYKSQEISFFQTMVRDYGNYNNVIYELWNEPTSQATSAIQGLCQDVANAIRAAENQYGYSHKLIICGSQTWSQYPNSYSINDPNAAYTFHGYFDNQSSHLSQLKNNCADAMSKGNAVFVTEYGASYCNHGVTDQAIQWCQDNDISMAAWSVNDKPEDWSIFTNNMDALTCVGQYYQSKVVNWKPATVVVTHPTSINFSSPSVTLPFVGSTAQLQLGFVPANTTDQTATFSSSNPSVVTVSSSGVVTAVAAGSATITATASDHTNGTLMATCTVTVQNLTNVALNKPVTVSSVETGSTTSVVGANAVDGNTSTRWSSAFSDPQTIQIDLQSSYSIQYISLNWETAAAKDYSIYISNDGTTWGSPIITRSGLAGGPRIDNFPANSTCRYIKLVGTARTTTYGYSLFEFSVYAPAVTIHPSGVSIIPTSVSVYTNSTYQLQATVSPSNATNKTVTWTSSNPAIATVDENGLITAKSAGSANITVTTVDGGFTDVCAVSVTNKAVTGVNIIPTSITIAKNGTSKLGFSITPSDATNKTVTWSSSNTAIVNVDVDGTITGVSPGTANVTVKTNDGNFTDVCVVTVTSVANLLSNGDFSNGLTSWSTYVDAAANATLAVTNGEFNAAITNGGSQVWHVQLYQGNLIVENGKTYTVSFTARATANRAITAIVEKNGSPYTLYGGANNNFNITTTNASYSFTFTMSQPTDMNGRVTFNLGNSNAGVYIDNVVLSTSSNPTFSQMIEAEQYSLMSGVQTEPTTDTGGGLNVGYIDTGDWLKYNAIAVPTTGTYVFEFRVASPNSTGVLSHDLNAGAIQLGTINVPYTGGWQNWQTISRTVTLNAGTYDFGIFAQVGGWNINWWKFSSQSGARIASSTPVIEENASEHFVVYPNPSNGSVNIQVSKPSRVKIMDTTGRTHFDQHIQESTTIDGLARGLYIINAQSAEGVKTQKLLVK